MTKSKYCSDCGKRLRIDSQGNQCYDCREKSNKIKCRVCGCYCKSDQSRKLSLCTKHQSLRPAKPSKTHDPQLSLTEELDKNIEEFIETEKSPIYKRLRLIAGELNDMSHEIEKLESSPPANVITDQIKALAQQL